MVSCSLKGYVVSKCVTAILGGEEFTVSIEAKAPAIVYEHKSSCLGLFNSCHWERAK